MQGPSGAPDSKSVEGPGSADSPGSADDPTSVDGSPVDQWGFWEDVVLFGVAFFGTISVLWMLPYYFIVLDLIAGLLVGIIALVTRRLGYLEGITDDGGTRFFQASALALVTLYAIAMPAVALGLRDVVSMPIVKVGCVLAGVLAGAVRYRR
jgi:hypothetical protein